MDWDVSRTWYHGSGLPLSTIREGSTITQDRDLARIFSHKPEWVVWFDNDTGERRIKHSGRQQGFLYRIAEEIGLSDVYPHPRTVMEPGQEWLTSRELRVELIGPTEVISEEILTPSEIAELQQRRAAG
jgi:hypothetical protein